MVLAEGGDFMKPSNRPKPLILVDEPSRTGQPAEALVRMWQQIEQLAHDEIKRTAPAYVPVELPVKVRYGLD
jgi:hypothetical protein